MSIMSSHWWLDSEDVRGQAELHNILHPQTPQAAQLSTKHSHHISNSFVIGDSVHFHELMQPFTFLGYIGKVTYDDVGQQEYEAKFCAPYQTNPPMLIRLNLNCKASKDHI
jgi:hypothetical protein